MEDITENIRRILVKEVNSGGIVPKGKKWTTSELTEDFEVLGFLAPFVHVKHRETGKKGTLMFRDRPRVYFGWQED